MSEVILSDTSQLRVSSWHYLTVAPNSDDE